MNSDTRSTTIQTFNVTRRSFLKRCTLAAAATGLPLWFVEGELMAASRKPKALSPNDRPGIALVGCGGQGRGDLNNAMRFGDVIAVCDVDDSHAQDTINKQCPKAAKYNDFRKLMERDDIHAIVNGTPDHWHTLVNLSAVYAGKDIYSEKPLTLTIDEGSRLVKAARKHKTIIQTGSQQRSDASFRLACELVRNGRIGKLKEVNVWLPAGVQEGPFKTAPVPAELNWDFWQGQSPAAEYVPQRCHSSFRHWYDYSGGTMTDWGAHHNDIARWALNQVGPTHVEGRPLIQPISGGFTAFAQYDVKLTYADGLVQNVRSTTGDNPWGGVEEPDGQRNGIRFEGTEGWIWVTRGAFRASDKELIEKPLPENAVRLYNSADHMANFFDCMKTRQLPVADVEIGHRSASICHLGVIALRTGKKLTWNAKKEKFVGDNAKEANKYVAREMRKPYDYSFVS